eukprot:s119_g2.t1
MAKAGDTRLRSAWEKARDTGGQKAKRDFYYSVFLLDPNVSKKSVHKESLERLKEVSKVTSAWLTKFQIAKLQGADPQDPEFSTLADSAVDGLEERPHEVSAWAAKGIKQCKATKEMGVDLVKVRESCARAKQEVDEMNQEEFAQAEQALIAQPETKQVVLGSRRNKPEERKAEEIGMAEEYSLAYKSLKRGVSALSTALDKASLLKECLSKAKNQSAQQKNSCKELEQLVLDFTQAKAKWQSELAPLNEALTTEEDKPEEGKAEITKVLELRLKCEEDTKSLQKAVGPHKVWAKNQGLI